MTINHNVTYSCRKNHQLLKNTKKSDIGVDSYILTGIDKLRAFYLWQELEFD